MLSDTLFDALAEIEIYQKERPQVYDPWTEDIAIVKHVMSALMERLDQNTPFDLFHPTLKETLNEQGRERWRTICEANIARWVERLRLLEPVSPQELVEKLDDAIRRQEQLLDVPNESNIQ
jgi:hypothetical protein